MSELFDGTDDTTATTPPETTPDPDPDSDRPTPGPFAFVAGLSLLLALLLGLFADPDLAAMWLAGLVVGVLIATLLHQL